MFDTLIFDLDGTLLDTLEDLRDSVNHVLAQFGCPARTTQEIRAFVGNGVHKLIELSLPENSRPELIEAAFDAMKAYYTAHCRIKTRPYDGILPLLAALKANGTRLAIVSNKNDEAVKSLCAHYFRDLVTLCVGQSEGVRRKPAPDSVLKAMQALGATPARTLYIGDSEVDKATADNAGVSCALVLWGFRDREALAALHPDFLIETPEELLHLQ